MGTLRAQVDILISHSLDAQGAVDADRAAQVAQAFRSSRAAHKTQILRQYKQRLARLQQRQQATITSAIELSASLKSDITKHITHTYPQAKSFVWQTDPNLIGGFTILVGDMWHDASSAHDLHIIREQLSQ